MFSGISCMFLQASPPSIHTHTRASHSAWENTMQCGNAWLILIRSSLFFITCFPSASKVAAPFFPSLMEFTVSVSGQRREMSGGGWFVRAPVRARVVVVVVVGGWWWWWWWGGVLRWRVLMVKRTCLYMSARSLKMKGWNVQRPAPEEEAEPFKEI